MTPSDITTLAANVALILLSAALLLTVVRIILGPTLPDRIVGLDLLVGIVMGFIAAFTIKTGISSYLDIAIALGLVGFLATVALARFVAGGKVSPTGDEEEP